MKVLLLLTLIGCSLAFTPGREYRYRYEGRLGLGMPEIRNKFSGVGIKVVVTIQFQGADETFIKLSDVQVGEYVGDAGVRVTNLLPIQFSPLRTDAKAVEEPFQVFFKKDNNQVMVVPQSDPEWIVNLRKSVAQLFLIEPIRGNFGFSEMLNKGDLSMEAFSVNEPTLFGICSADYAVRPFEAAVDGNSFPVRNDEDAFVLTRTVNFDKCQEQVRLMHTSVANINDITKNLFGDIASRSSVMTVKFVGKAGDFKIQEGNVQGYFSVNPFGVPTDKLMSLTNQTFFLESESQIRSKFVVPTPTRFVNTFFMEVASPFTAPQNPPTFVNYYNKKDARYSPFMSYNVMTGIPFSQSYIKKFQSTLDKLITEASTLMFSVGDVPSGKIDPVYTNEARITSLLDSATQVVNGVDVQGLEQLFEKYFNDKTEVGQMKMRLFIDVCAASGFSAPVKFLVDQMQRQRISPERITSIFVTFANNFIATPVLPEVLRYVKTVDFESHPFMATNVFINFATILRKVCITKETIPFQVFGREKCDPRIITEDFIPFLKQKFEDAQDSFERCTIIQTVSNIGTPEAVKFVASIATGDYDVREKEVAIYGLHYKTVQEMMKKDDVFNVLMPIVHNAGEDPFIRQVAISVLVSWKPSPSWWYRLASSSWKEPSESVGAFIYYLIKNNYYNADLKNSQENRIAHFILPLTKRFPETGSVLYVYDRQNPEDFTNSYMDFGSIKDDQSSFPRAMFSSIVPNFGGVNVPFFEALYSRSFNEISSAAMVEKFTQILPEEMQTILRSASDKRTRKLFNEIKKMFKSKLTTDENSNMESELFLRLFSNLQLIAPFNSKTFPVPFNTNTFDFFKSLANGKNLHLSKFFNPAPTQLYLPTEIGIPFIARVSAPTVQSAEGSVMINFRPNTFELDLTTNYKFASKIITDFEAYVPWNEKRVSSGVETFKSLNVPARFKFSFENRDNLANASFSIIPTYDREFAGLYTHTIPYVSMRSAYDGQLVPEYEKFELITVNGNQQGIHKSRTVMDKESTGIDSTIYYEGDVPYPFTYGNFYENFRYPYKMINKLVSPSAKLSSSVFTFNFGASETNEITSSVAFTLPLFFNDKKSDTENDNQVFNIRITAAGSVERFFESNYQNKVVSREGNLKQSQIFYRNVKQFSADKPQMFCVNVRTRQPIYHDFSTLLNQLRSRNMDYLFTGKIRGGASCEGAQFATIKGAFKVSDQKKSSIEEEITNELTFNNPSETNYEETFVYDQAYMTAEFKEPMPTFFTNMTYNAYDVLRGSQFPHTYHNYYGVKNPIGRITVEGERYVDGAWNLRAEIPTENVNLDYFEIPLVYSFPYMFFGDMNFKVFEIFMRNY